MQGRLKEQYVSERMKKAQYKHIDTDIEFMEFEKLLDFDDKTNKLEVFMLKKAPKIRIKDDTFILDRENVLRDKKAIKKSNETNYKSDLDFTMFDNLLNDFDNVEIPKVVIPKKNNKFEKLGLLKREIEYYQNKIGGCNNLEQLEEYEARLLALKDKIDSLKATYGYVFYDYKFEAVTVKELIKTINQCKKELELIEKNENVDRLTKSQIIDKINDSVNLNIEKQKQLLTAIKKEVDTLANKVVNKLYFCMVKRMIFNLYRLIVGMYKVENSKKNHLKLNNGMFLIINAIIGIHKAVNMDFSSEGYYYYKNYVKENMSSKEIIMITHSLMSKSLILLDELQIDLKANFSKFKDYTKDYEEVYFKLSKFRELISEQKNQCEMILDLILRREKQKIK